MPDIAAKWVARPGRRAPTRQVNRIAEDPAHRLAQANWRRYNLTTVKVDLAERTRALVRPILRRLKNPGLPAMTKTIRTRLVVRGTAA